MTQPASLPIDELLPGLIASLKEQPNAIITAAPGAGKSTRVPVAVSARFDGQVLLLQPRRVAARAAAARMAEEQGWRLGEEIGYQIRFENRTSARSRIVVMTEGILSRRIQRDPFLDGVGCVIIDEFHERNLHTDMAIAMLKEIQQEVRPDLKIIVMSATLDPAPICAFLQTEAVFTSKGRLFPLEITHGARTEQRPAAERMADAIAVYAQSTAIGDAPHVLAFLPGIGEIRRVNDSLPAALRPHVHILHSSVSAADQEAALHHTRQQKIILATNIAETSLTIDGVGLVIDSGLARVPVHDTRLGFDRLETRRISKASAKQRAGRAGRSGPGHCVRLFSAEEYGAMADYESPEIQRLDLAGLILTLKAYGVARVEDFKWFEAPPRASLDRAMQVLAMLDAIDEAGMLTEWGKALAPIPLHPRLGSVFLHGIEAGFPEATAWLCALLEAGDLSATGTGNGHHESDVLDRLEEVMRSRSATWSMKNAVGQLERLAKTFRAIRRGTSTGQDIALRQALLRGFPDRVVLRRGKGESRGVMVGRRGVCLSPKSRVTGSELFIALDIRENDYNPAESTVYSGSGVEREWLEQLYPNLYRLEEGVRTSGGRLTGVRRAMFADLILSEKDTGRLPEGFDVSRATRMKLLAERGSALECFLAIDNVNTWLQRYLFLHVQLGGLEYPIPDYELGLEMGCEGARSENDFKQNALHCLHATLPPSAVRGVAEQAPDYLELPSGNRARIEYPEVTAESGLPDAKAIPKVSARVQELFGLTETPRVAGGRVPILVQLLSPAMRPVQVTRDLKSFWDTTYQEVRKELRARYPKHPWPEDPWTAPAVSVGRRRR